MIDHSHASHSSPVELPSRSGWWRYLLPLVWLGLGVRLAVALARHESVQQDFLSLALVAFFMTTAVLGSRVWLWFHDRWARNAEARQLTGPSAAGS